MELCDGITTVKSNIINHYAFTKVGAILRVPTGVDSK